MENAYQLWKEGKSGSHHVWGKIELEKISEFSVIVFLHEKYKWLNKLGRLIGITHLDQQIRILFASNSYDILYAPYSTQNTKFLLFLKLLKLYRKPIVVTIHSPFLGTNSSSKWIRWLTKKLLLTYDASIYLSESLMNQGIEKLGIKKEVAANQIYTAQWGPDLTFYNKSQFKAGKEEMYLISAGHTSRDYVTLINAFRQLDYQLKIFCTPKSMPNIENLPKNVTIYSEFIPYFELMKFYLNSKIILIPLKYETRNEGCQGMTSIQDVVALGKPTVITKNKTLNLDVEKEGFGIFVDMGDVSGWVKAINMLMNDEVRMEKMKQNALSVYQNKFNAEIFAKQLKKVFLDVKAKAID
ncbi:glycosyltransferase [Cyclobacterium roseum]|uniref:glycosyltransferase n=1 Tax=Cyclobacterium roseum TaxID=2666137 RepID=UPI001390AAFE|nr:glycosyltransferase [Cyclobacterium roseum]